MDQRGVYVPAISRLSSDLLWLSERGVAPSRIAAAFGVTPERVRTLLHRRRQSTDQDEPRSRLKRTLRVEDRLFDLPRDVKDVDALISAIRSIKQQHGQQHRQSIAIAELNQLLPLCGFPANPRLRRVQAELYSTRAWFRANAGLSRSAFEDATMAVGILDAVVRGATRRRQDIVALIEAERYRAHALLLAREPTRALVVLDRLRRAAESAGRGLGSEHLRLLGVAYFQLELDRESIAAFENAHRLALDSSDFSHPIQLAMTGMRHLNCLRSNCDDGEHLAADAREYFGRDSLEASMTVHWYVASALSTDSREHHRIAHDLLDANREVAHQFGHQASVWFAMQATDKLSLGPDLRRQWLRRALYSNAFSSR